MKPIKKIPAFTLSEMIVVLILTSIVVGLAFTVLSLVQKQMLGIQENFQTNTELRLLEQSLWLDFNRYNDISFDAIENALLFKSEVDSIEYDFQIDKIVKQRDTFNITLSLKTFYFNGKPIEKGSIDAIKLEASEVFKNQHIFVFKQNDATVFMK